MAINVNRLVVGFNCNLYNTAYFTRVAKSCPVSPTAPQVDGSFLICKAGGLAWFVAPASTQITSAWANGCYQNINTTSKCCISEWGVLGNCLSAIGYTPTEWFIPSYAQLLNPGWVCRTNWGSLDGVSIWSSTQCGGDGNRACRVDFNSNLNCCGIGYSDKSNGLSVRAFRCVTY